MPIPIPIPTPLNLPHHTTINPSTHYKSLSLSLSPSSLSLPPLPLSLLSLPFPYPLIKATFNSPNNPSTIHSSPPTQSYSTSSIQPIQLKYTYITKAISFLKSFFTRELPLPLY